MRRRTFLRVAGAMIAVAAVVAPVWLLRGTREDRPSTASQSPAPWPYCAPDAAAPTGTTEGTPSGAKAKEPFAVALLVVRSVGPELDRLDETGVSDPEGMYERRALEIDALDWISAFGWRSDQVSSVVGSKLVDAVGHSNFWEPVTSRSADGHSLLFGVAGARGDGSLSIRFAVDLDEPSSILIGSGGIDSEVSRLLDGFLQWPANPHPGMSVLELIHTWNVEADAPPEDFPRMGPISHAWEGYVAEVAYGSNPDPGTEEWWDAAPAWCRNVSDAPPSILDQLERTRIWLRVPAPWRSIPDAAICFTISEGSNGCWRFNASSSGLIVADDVYFRSGSPVIVQLARLTDAGVSWVQRIPLGTISASTLEEGSAVLVELDPAAAPASFEDAEAYPHEDAIATRPLTLQEERELESEVPAATPSAGVGEP